MEGLEAEHGTGDALDETVILLNDVVEIFNLQDFNDLPSPARRYCQSPD